jgi:hypothetical protein
MASADRQPRSTTMHAAQRHGAGLRVVGAPTMFANLARWLAVGCPMLVLVNCSGLEQSRDGSVDGDSTADHSSMSDRVPRDLRAQVRAVCDMAVRTSSFDRSCVQDSDCVGVEEGALCGQCSLSCPPTPGCFNAAINRREHANFNRAVDAVFEAADKAFGSRGMGSCGDLCCWGELGCAGNCGPVGCDINCQGIKAVCENCQCIVRFPRGGDHPGPPGNGCPGADSGNGPG